MALPSLCNMGMPKKKKHPITSPMPSPSTALKAQVLIVKVAGKKRGQGQPSKKAQAKVLPVDDKVPATDDESASVDTKAPVHIR